MKRQNLIIFGIVSLAAAAGIATALYFKKDRGFSPIPSDTESNQLDSYQYNPELEWTNPSSQPAFDRNGQLTNHMNMLVGKTLYPKGQSATVRTEPRVNDGLWNNQITTIKGQSTPIGKIISQESGQEDPPMRWFRVEFPDAHYLFWKTGYVRADVVTFK
jgi:hypothetical protein